MFSVINYGTFFFLTKYSFFYLSLGFFSFAFSKTLSNRFFYGKLLPYI